jgi:hypothetical protein
MTYHNFLTGIVAGNMLAGNMDIAWETLLIMEKNTWSRYNQASDSLDSE